MVSPLDVLNADQLRNARIIAKYVHDAKLPARVLTICLDTACTESGIFNLANGANPASMAFPHDIDPAIHEGPIPGVGYDHGSVGVFQQQVGGAPNSTANWGTVEQCQTVATSTALFVQGLHAVAWQTMTDWDAAQAVQRSFDPTGGNYKRNDPQAIAYAAALWAELDTPEAADMIPYFARDTATKKGYLVTDAGFKPVADSERAFVANGLHISAADKLSKSTGELAITATVLMRAPVVP